MKIPSAKMAVPLVVTCLIIGATAGARIEAANLLGNPGFEETAAYPNSVVPVATSVGAWARTTYGNATVDIVQNPVWEGQYSARVLGNAAGSTAQGWFYQDVNALPADTSYELSFWVYPDYGEQWADLLIGWDRGWGLDWDGYAALKFSSTATEFYGGVFPDQGEPVAGAALPYGEWSLVQMYVDACNAEPEVQVAVNGTTIITTDFGPPPVGTLTVLLGQPLGAITTGQLFYYDDVQLTAYPCGDTDTDGDGIPDESDACPNSDLAPFVAIGDCVTGVPNRLLENGCSFNDLILECKANANNHGNFVSCVSHLTNAWKESGYITGKEKGTIMRCK